MKPTLLLTLLLAACASASGYDAKHYAGETTAPADPDTAPLPPEPKTTIPDPVNSVPIAAAPAPSPSPAMTASASASVAAAKPAPPKPAPPKAPTPEAECGSKENPCPMQKFMRGQMTVASTPEALAAAFTRVSAMSPNGSWTWASIAKKGAELATSGDVAGAKAQCKACHDQHRDAYKKQYRARKI